jgi:hypothetical protein
MVPRRTRAMVPRRTSGRAVLELCAAAKAGSEMRARQPLEPAQRLHRQAGQHFEDDVVRQRDRDLVGIDLLLDRFFAVLELAPGRKETGKQLPESPHVGCDGACLLAMMHELEISEAPAPRWLRIYSYMAGSE